jgi:hypothetical protein
MLEVMKALGESEFHSSSCVNGNFDVEALIISTERGGWVGFTSHDRPMCCACPCLRVCGRARGGQRKEKGYRRRDISKMTLEIMAFGRNFII